MLKFILGRQIYRDSVYSEYEIDLNIYLLYQNTIRIWHKFHKLDRPLPDLLGDLLFKVKLGEYTARFSWHEFLACKFDKII